MGRVFRTSAAVGVAILIGGLVAAWSDGDRVLIAGLGAWEIIMVGIAATFLGTALFAGVTLWTRTFAPIAAVILLVGSLLAPLAFAGVTFGLFPGEPDLRGRDPGLFGRLDLHGAVGRGQRPRIVNGRRLTSDRVFAVFPDL